MSERPATSAGDLPAAFADPVYRQAVVDLLGVIAYGEISAVERLAEDARLAPTLEDKVALLGMASTDFGHLTQLLARLTALGAEPYAAMAPFRAAIDDFHAHTAPADWFEGLVKAYVGDGLAKDFYREIAAFVDEETRALIFTALEDTGYARFVIDRVRAAIEADPRVGGRLALWGRRLMGEALVQGQQVAAERDALTSLLTGAGAGDGLDLAAIGRMFTRLTERHAERMAELGLAS